MKTYEQAIAENAHLMTWYVLCCASIDMALVAQGTAPQGVYTARDAALVELAEAESAIARDYGVDNAQVYADLEAESTNQESRAWESRNYWASRLHESHAC